MTTSKSKAASDAATPPAVQGPTDPTPADEAPPADSPEPHTSAPALGGRLPEPGQVVLTEVRSPSTNALVTVPVMVVHAEEDDDGMVRVDGFRFDMTGVHPVCLELFHTRADAKRYQDSFEHPDLRVYTSFDKQPNRYTGVAWWADRSA